MGQGRFLSSVHARVRESASSGAILDAYRLADELVAGDRSCRLSRSEAVRTVLAAAVVYGAALFLDPQPQTLPTEQDRQTASIVEITAPDRG